MQRIYFDNAATTPTDPRVLETMLRVGRDVFGNPSSIHAEGRKARATIEEARRTVAGILNASIGEVFFTSCGTESNNMILKNAVRDLGVQRIISARTEHHCVLHSLERLQKEGAIRLVFVDLDEKGRVREDHLVELLASGGEQTLVSLMHSNNEIGTMIDLGVIGRLCSEYGALFHSDTVQTVGYFPIDLQELPVHFISGSAHKFYGPKGCGFVYINNEYQLKPFIDGGSQERNMRAGTENIAGIAGLAHALELAAGDMERRADHIRDLHEYFANRLREKFPEIRFNGDPEGRGHYKVLSVSFPPAPGVDLLLLNLDIAGISASGGSACSSGVDVGSHVLTALGTDPDETTIRFSFSHQNTREEADRVLEELCRQLARRG